jgi:hypothetical protein
MILPILDLAQIPIQRDWPEQDDRYAAAWRRDNPALVGMHPLHGEPQILGRLLPDEISLAQLKGASVDYPPEETD